MNGNKFQIQLRHTLKEWKALKKIAQKEGKTTREWIKTRISKILSSDIDYTVFDEDDKIPVILDIPGFMEKEFKMASRELKIPYAVFIDKLILEPALKEQQEAE